MYKYNMSHKDWYSPFCNINKYIETYVINNCISSLHSGLAIKELCMARDGSKLEHFDYSYCFNTHRFARCFISCIIFFFLNLNMM